MFDRVLNTPLDWKFKQENFRAMFHFYTLCYLYICEELFHGPTSKKKIFLIKLFEMNSFLHVPKQLLYHKWSFVIT